MSLFHSWTAWCRPFRANQTALKEILASMLSSQKKIAPKDRARNGLLCDLAGSHIAKARFRGLAGMVQAATSLVTARTNPRSHLIAVFPLSGAKTPARPGQDSSTMLDTRQGVPSSGNPTGLPFSRRTIGASVIGQYPITVSRVSTLAIVPEGGKTNSPFGVRSVISCWVRFNISVLQKKIAPIRARNGLL